MGSADAIVPRVELQVLGPLQLLRAGEPQVLGGARQRAVLALLAVNRNRVVSMDTLIEAVWEDDPPPAAVSSVQVAISALRRILAPAGVPAGPTLTTAAPGYRLQVDAEAFDLTCFSALRDSGVQHFRADRFDLAAADLGAALHLWRGRALEDLAQYRFAADFAVAVEEERLVALQLRIDADLLGGRPQAVLAELTELTARHPLREHFWGQLATTLYRLDRQADALNCLRRLREALDDELGIDPSPSIAELELRILRQDLAPEPVAAARAQELAATVGEPLSDAVVELVASWGPVFPVFARGIQIGRAPECDIVVTDDRVSRQHLVVRPGPDGPTVVDLGSRNGTYVNGRRITGECPLDDGAVIGVGRLALTVRLPSASPGLPDGEVHP